MRHYKKRTINLGVTLRFGTSYLEVETVAVLFTISSILPIGRVGDPLMVISLLNVKVIMFSTGHIMRTTFSIWCLRAFGMLSLVNIKYSTVIVISMATLFTFI